MILDTEQKFIENWMRKAYSYAAQHSDDPDTKNGAVLVAQFTDGHSGIQAAAFGANRLPDGVERLPERMIRPLKYEYLEHAERDALYKAVNIGMRVKGATLVCPYIACKDCARAIAMLGVTRVIGHKELTEMAPPRWQASIAIGNQILDDYGVTRDYWSGTLGVIHRFDEKDVAL